MKRAERRRIERTAKKMNLDGITAGDIQRAMDHAELRDQITASVRMEQLAKKVVQKQNEQDLEDIQLAAANQSYFDWCHKYEKEFVEAFLISFSLAVHEKFPRWGIDAVSRMVSDASAWTDKYIMEYKRDLISYRNLYAITFGEPMQLQIVCPKTGEPIVSGKDVPKAPSSWTAISDVEV